MSRPRSKSTQGTISKFFQPKPKRGQRSEVNEGSTASGSLTVDSVEDYDSLKKGVKRQPSPDNGCSSSSTKRQRHDPSPSPSLQSNVEISAETIQKLQTAKAKLDSYIHDEASPQTPASQISIDDLKRPDACHIDDTYKLFEPNNVLNNSNNEHNENGNNSGDEGVSEQTRPESRKRMKGKLSQYASKQKCSVVKVRQKYTPLEQQFMEIKEKYPDAILFVECGYKYRFFGDDAEIAGKELSIFPHLDHNFMTASIPTHRLYVHVRRLVAKGYKVGVVKQTETAALKAAGENRNTPFTRQLSALYTKATLIGEDVDPTKRGLETQAQQTTNAHLTCLFEPDLTSRNKTHQIALMSVQPSTGEIIYDVFNDVATRRELETRLAHLQPAELLLPQSLTTPTEKVIKQLVAFSCRTDDRVRLDRLEDSVFEPNAAFQGVKDFYGDSPALSVMLQLPKAALGCLNALLTYLKDFNLHNVLKIASNVRQFSSVKEHMHLPASTLRNLELFKNLTDGREHGSLIWVMDQTTSRFGSRLLRQWLSKPLLDLRSIELRQEAVSSLMTEDSFVITQIRELLPKLPDLEKGLCTIFHKKCSTYEFMTVCKALSSVYDVVSVASTSKTGSVLLRELLTDLPDLLDGVSDWSNALEEGAAKSGDKTKLFVDETGFPAVLQCKADILSLEGQLEAYRKEVAKILGLLNFTYKTIMGTQFLIDVKNSDVKRVPKEWIKINSTKATSRFHTPFIIATYKKLCQARERLTKVCSDAWNQFLESFEDVYPRYRRAVQHLATLDALLSLASLAKQEGFCRPTISTGAACEIHIEAGRHPVVNVLLGEMGQYVPNDTSLGDNGVRCMVITGPNMGGKSSYIKQVALLTLIAQIGSYVPAASARLSIMDAIYTRMGASDELFAGRSTFMVELQEASEIMSLATDKSLVILDELGRGTSTHDGVAIAYATLRYFIEQVKCLTLFVTHYPPLAEIEQMYPSLVANYHMSFLLHDDEQDNSKGSSMETEVITFLYQLVGGVAHRSYGLNVARLADIPEPIVRRAAEKSHGLEDAVQRARSQKTSFARLYTAKECDIKDIIGSLAHDS